MIRASTAICEIGIPVERSPDSMRIRARSRVTAIANRIASLAVLASEDLLFTPSTVADPKATCASPLLLAESPTHGYDPLSSPDKCAVTVATGGEVSKLRHAPTPVLAPFVL